MRASVGPASRTGAGGGALAGAVAGSVKMAIGAVPPPGALRAGSAAFATGPPLSGCIFVAGAAGTAGGRRLFIPAGRVWVRCRRRRGFGHGCRRRAGSGLHTRHAARCGTARVRRGCRRYWRWRVRRAVIGRLDRRRLHRHRRGRRCGPRDRFRGRFRPGIERHARDVGQDRQCHRHQRQQSHGDERCLLPCRESPLLPRVVAVRRLRAPERSDARRRQRPVRDVRTQDRLDLLVADR